ncbi:MAG TPA: hypothetical protein V6C84_26810 [Coleofasciculaceae cyanobacterium]|jgi:hypothetical protein
MSATTFKRVLFWFGTAAFTISLNGALALAEASDMTQRAISDQKSSSKLQSLEMQSELQSFSPASTLSNELEVEIPPSISTSSEALRSDFSQANSIAQQPSSPAGTSPSQPTPRPAAPNGGVISDPIETPSGEGQFNSPTQTPGNSETGVDEVDSTPGTSAPAATPETEVDESGNPVPDATAPDSTFDSDTDTPDTDTSNTNDSDSDSIPGAGISPGRATRSGPSYIGIGGNIGIGSGDTAVGEGAFAIISKIGLTNYLSVRPSVLFSDSPTFLIPVTFDFIPGITDVTEDLSGELGLRISPFIGGGVAVSTGDDVDASFLLTGGVDVPIRERVSANASVNFTLGDETAIGLILGIGYNF